MHTEQNLNFLENSIYFFPVFFFLFSELLCGSLTPPPRPQPTHCSLSFPVTAVRLRAQITPHMALRVAGLRGWGGGGYLYIGSCMLQLETAVGSFLTEGNRRRKKQETAWGRCNQAKD